MVVIEWSRENGRFYQKSRFQNGTTDGSIRMVVVERSVLLVERMVLLEW